MSSIKELTATVVFECDPQDEQRIRAYVTGALKGTFRHIRDANTAIALYDGEEMIGMDVTGKPSDAMIERMDDVFYEETA